MLARIQDPGTRKEFRSLHAAAAPYSVTSLAVIPNAGLFGRRASALDVIPSDVTFALHISDGEALQSRGDDNEWKQVAFGLSEWITEDTGSDIRTLEEWLVDLEELALLGTASEEDLCGCWGVVVRGGSDNPLESQLKQFADSAKESASDSSRQSIAGLEISTLIVDGLHG
ncbi:MAG: hypothetical protein ACI841_001928 [Planctomycetota bacterium]